MFDPSIYIFGCIIFFCGMRKAIAFFTFKDNLFIFSHGDILFSSIFNCVPPALIFRVLHSVVSSA